MDLNVKWIAVVTLLLFGGLALYKRYGERDKDVEPNAIAINLADHTVRIKNEGFRGATIRNAENYLIFVGKFT